jgi:hypothetical protein
MRSVIRPIRDIEDGNPRIEGGEMALTAGKPLNIIEVKS